MSKIKLEGMKDELDVLAIVKSFEAFRDGIQLVSDKATDLVVDLAFESTVGKASYNFKQDEVVALKDVKFDTTTKKLMFSVVFGVADKWFYNEEAELITVNIAADETNAASTHNLSDHIKETFTEAFSEVKINSIPALQAMVRNNGPLADILNDPAKFLDEYERVGNRAKAYVKLEKYGRY